jgi:hypothetical protein
MEKIRNSYKVFIGKPEEKRPLGRSILRWDDNIRIDLMKIRWEGIALVHLAQERDQWWAPVNIVMNLKVP